MGENNVESAPGRPPFSTFLPLDGNKVERGEMNDALSTLFPGPERWRTTRPGAATARRYAKGMCRNIRTLYNFDPPATDEEIRASALQYVRKLSGFNKPSRANEEAFERALEAVTAASARLLSELRTTAPPKDREVEAAKARARSAQRYAA
jgi:hypothetical protein